MKPHAFDFRKESMKYALLALSIVVMASLACQVTGVSPLAQPTAVSQPQAIPPVQVDSAIVMPEAGSLEALYQSVLPGVVSIRTDVAEGSGFMFDAEGHVVTNEHVVEGANTIEINFSSGF